MKQDMKTVNDIIKIIGESEITEVSIEEEGFKLFIKKPKLTIANQELAEQEIEEEDNSVEDNVENKIEEIVSETVGTFYTIDQDEEIIVSEGMSVEEGQRIGYIKAIGLKTDVISSVSGIVKEVVSKNGKIAEYGQVLVRIEKS